MPDKGNNIVTFQNFHKQMPVPFVIYADFEAITETYLAVHLITPNHTKNHIRNILIAVMVISLFAVMVTNTLNRLRFTKVKKLCIKLMEEMPKEVEQCKKIAAKRFNKPLAMTDEDEANFAKATKCRICDTESLHQNRRPYKGSLPY